MKTWERLFKENLATGTHCITMRLGDRERVALVEITARGTVYMLVKPRSEDMYASWMRVVDNEQQYKKKKVDVILWGARDPELMKLFDNPVKTITKE